MSVDLDPSRTKRIAALWIGRVGDLIVATPFLRALRDRFPESHLLLLTSEPCAETAKLLPWVDEVVIHRQFYRPLASAKAAAALLGRRLDLLVDLNPAFSKTSATWARLARADVKLAFRKGTWDGVFTHQVQAENENEHMVDRYARLAKALGARFDSRLELRLSSEHEAEARALLARSGFTPEAGRQSVLIHPGNFKKFDHRWPEEKFAALTTRLFQDDGLRLVYLAGPGEEKPVRAILSRVHGRVPLVCGAPIGAIGAVLKQMDLAVLNVTGTMHLAAAVGAPTFGFYTGYADQIWRPRGPQHTGLASRSWGSCRDISVDDADVALRTTLARLRG